MNGIINVLKPPGMTSSGVVVYLRRILHEKRIGHTGTLDPGAAGVLPICVGRSTRLSDYIMDHKKRYLAEVTFGASTDTLDSYGVVTARADVCVSGADVEKALVTGEIMQIPPAYSAVRIDGRKSYQLARKGGETEKPPRKITVYSAGLVRQTRANSFLVRIECSKGTYIRVIAEELGRSIGAPAYLSFLLRESSGGYEVNGAYTLDEIAAMAADGDYRFLMSAESAVSDLAAVCVDDRFAIENGQTLPFGNAPEGLFRMYCGGDFYGLGSACGDGLIKLKILLKDD